jgi:hypothetical protein
MYRFDRKNDGGTGSWLPGIRALAHNSGSEQSTDAITLFFSINKKLNTSRPKGVLHPLPGLES